MVPVGNNSVPGVATVGAGFHVFGRSCCGGWDRNPTLTYRTLPGRWAQQWWSTDRASLEHKDVNREVASLLAAARSRPTALVPLDNAMTVTLMRALKDLRLDVPDDVTLVCYDDF